MDLGYIGYGDGIFLEKLDAGPNWQFSWSFLVNCIQFEIKQTKIFYFFHKFRLKKYNTQIMKRKTLKNISFTWF